MTLSAAEHFEWLALRRVHRDGVTKDQDGGFVDFGQPLGAFLAEIIAELLDQGLLDVSEPTPWDGRARVRHTEEGASRYSELCRQQRHQTLSPQTPAGRRSSAESLAPPGGQPEST